MAADLVSRSHNLLDRVEGTLRHQSQHNKALSMELQPYALRCLRKKTAMEYRIETSPRTAVSARRSSIIRSQEFS